MLKGWNNMTMYEQYRYSSCPCCGCLKPWEDDEIQSN